MIDFVLVIIILAVAGTAMMYIVKSKKKGVKCIGCPSAGTCKNAVSDNGNCDCKCGSDSHN